MRTQGKGEVVVTDTNSGSQQLTEAGLSHWPHPQSSGLTKAPPLILQMTEPRPKDCG